MGTIFLGQPSSAHVGVADGLELLQIVVLDNFVKGGKILIKVVDQGTASAMRVNPLKSVNMIVTES